MIRDSRSQTALDDGLRLEVRSHVAVSGEAEDTRKPNEWDVLGQLESAIAGPQR